MNGLIVDLFAGGGGASQGIEQGLGRGVSVAINHWDLAIQMHEANHPLTAHSRSDVFSRKVKPRLICEGQPVDLLWLSPDCTHHSKAKGGRPVCRKRRGLAWVGVKWATQVRPKVIMLENVEEFQDWGPINKATGQPDKRRAGLTFKQFVGRLRGLGYQVDWRELVAADYGAPTTRKRLYLIARCDGRPIVWPEPTHAPMGDLFLPPWRSAAEVIDWSLPCPSIFMTREEAKAWAKATGNGIPRRPLVDGSMERIAEGVQKFIIDQQEPFIVQLNHTGGFRGQSINTPLNTVTAARDATGIIVPYLIGIDNQSSGRGAAWPINGPLRTITTENRHALVSTFLTKFYGTNIGSDMRHPVPTVTSGGQHLGEVRAFLVKYYGTRDGQSLRQPMGTVTTHDRFGLVMIYGALYQIVDIGLRMLTPRELARAQGFPDSYILTGNKSDQVALIGNSVCPPVAEALVRANCLEFDLVEVAA